MGEQRTFASVAWSQKGKVTRRERFLAEMDAVIPWDRLMALIEPHFEAVLHLGDRQSPEPDYALLLVGVDTDPIVEHAAHSLDLDPGGASDLFRRCWNAQRQSPVGGERNATLGVIELRRYLHQRGDELSELCLAVVHHAVSLLSSSDSRIGHAEA